MNTIGTIVHEIQPGPNNPRNSEGSFMTRSDGTILYVYSRFRGDLGHDDAPSDLATLSSGDGGEHWSDGRIVVTSEEHQAKNVMSVTLKRMRDGELGLFYSVRAAANDVRTFLRRSGDEGASFGAARVCIEPEGYYVVNNDRIVRLSSGRLVIPSAFHRNGYDSYAKNRSVRFDSRAVDVFFLSDDDGESWREASTKCALPHSRNCRTGLQEPGILELQNGVLWAWARTDLGVQYEMFSFDQGESWTTPEPSRFTSPASPLSAKRMPGSNVIVAVWNPIPNYNGRVQFHGGAWTGGRTPLVLATSPDEGRTWSDPVVVEDDPERGYCYTAIHFTDSAMLLGYCAGGIEDGGCLNRVRIRKIPFSELLE